LIEELDAGYGIDVTIFFGLDKKIIQELGLYLMREETIG
jgi:hypothetical protein